MKQLGLNQSDLARRMKVSRPYITKVLRQDVNFSFHTAAKLAAALEMDFFPELRAKECGEGVNGKLGGQGMNSVQRSCEHFSAMGSDPMER